ncbi:MAG: hypothetical protein ABA06_02680 [Parcubacteria bacterium C7867-001]|nr:MAG: hypothetical protein ABA06_02680 [Parcubacteria bacterium C7867-001]
MQSDILFFLGVFLFIFIVWVATGGPDRPISFAGPYLYPITTSGVNATAYGTARTQGDAPKGSIGSQLKGAEQNLEELKKQVADLKTWGESSPYRGLVTIDHSTSGPSETDRKKEYVTIRLSSSADTDVNISGWKLESAASNLSATIGHGAKTARTGHINNDAPIVLTPGDSAIIETGSSPIGESFKENICSGYLEEFQDFNPSLSQSCPAPADEFKYYEGNDTPRADQCYDYLKTLRRCTLTTEVPKGASSECRNLVQDYLNYNGCVSAHQNESKFYGTAWRVFLGKSKELWRSAHETIRLIDQNGKTVDVFAY